MKMIDVILNIDSLYLDDDECVEDVLDHIREKYAFGYEPTYEILYEENIEEVD